MAYELVLRCQTCDALSKRYVASTYNETMPLARGDGWKLRGNLRRNACCPACTRGVRSVSPALAARREQIDTVYAPLRDRREAERRELEEAVFAQARRPLPAHLARLVGDDGRVRVGARRSLVSEGVR